MTGFDHREYDVLMDHRGLEQAREIGAHAWFEFPGLATTVMARMAADPTSILDDEEAIADEIDRAAEPAWDEAPAAQTALDDVAAALVPVVRSWSLVLKDIDQEQINAIVGIGGWATSGLSVDDPPKPKIAGPHRHGHAAVCPRHGPTKGGLCRKCQR
jgi:hypothetical protein